MGWLGVSQPACWLLLLPCRAVQLFEWARSLPPDHPQAAELCVPGLYATMIELHGQWRQPGKALRLLGDAKARSIEVGAEIYSALIQALCRWGGSRGSWLWRWEGATAVLAMATECHGYRMPLWVGFQVLQCGESLWSAMVDEGQGLLACSMEHGLSK